ncbi:mfs transporter protein [Penicillium chermesinum]|uniref:Mfs transporter protein n=1 Tax=Penicillium chermesinum TaxID=63820 RepID=A0A9W9PJW0_9EURO|nr:mfs transporter protein [Penicillium chermesinum]KAJ5247316.1 mfs transporter protein [Penicillium chermesinum]
MVSVVGGFMLAGFGTSATGYYTPFVYAGSILMSVSTGLLMTVHPRSTSRAKWVGFQILCGMGIGLGEEQGLYMVQTTLPEHDIATGIGIILFAQTFGGALFVSVAQAVFLGSITEALNKIAPDLNPQSIVSGATASLPGSSTGQVSAALQAVYGRAIKDALRVGLILATVSSLGAVLYDWKSLKANTDHANGEHGNGHELERIGEQK